MCTRFSSWTIGECRMLLNNIASHGYVIACNNPVFQYVNKISPKKQFVFIMKKAPRLVARKNPGPTRKQQKWNSKDDVKLRKMIEIYGYNIDSIVERYRSDRTPKDVIERVNFLQQSEWTQQEDDFLRCCFDIWQFDSRNYCEKLMSHSVDAIRDRVAQLVDLNDLNSMDQR